MREVALKAIRTKKGNEESASCPVHPQSTSQHDALEQSPCAVFAPHSQQLLHVHRTGKTDSVRSDALSLGWCEENGFSYHSVAQAIVNAIPKRMARWEGKCDS